MKIMGTALNTHPGHPPQGKWGLPRVPPQCPLFPLRNDLCQVTLKKRGGESEKSALLNIQMQENSEIGTSAAFLSDRVQDLAFFLLPR